MLLDFLQEPHFCDLKTDEVVTENYCQYYFVVTSEP